MNDQESLAFIRAYFDELFGKRNLSALDLYLDPDYFDDDIGDASVDHIRNSKKYLAHLFEAHPTIGVDVNAAIAREDVISAYLEWYVCEQDVRKTLRKGVAIFVVRGGKIVKRHTYIYYKSDKKITF